MAVKSERGGRLRVRSLGDCMIRWFYVEEEGMKDAERMMMPFIKLESEAEESVW